MIESDDEGRCFDGITPEDYRANRYRRFAQQHGERMDNLLWHAAVRSQWGAYRIAERFGEAHLPHRHPIWCFARNGMSRTVLTLFQEPAQVLWIAGEHEDSYDPDFCIYNDVVLTGLDGTVQIYGYPERDFPPTDYHSATLVQSDAYGESVYIIGRLGYAKDRAIGTTPVYRLDLSDMRILEVHVRGIEPSWLHHHGALLLPSRSAIAVWGGYVFQDEKVRVRNHQTWLFDLHSFTWSMVGQIDLDEAWSVKTN